MKKITLLIALVLMTGCGEPPAAKSAITEALDDMQQAVENGHAAPVLERLADDFALDRSGQTLSRRQTKRLLQLTLRRRQSIQVVLSHIRVQQSSTTQNNAEARFSAVVTSSAGSAWLPSDGAAYRIRSQWRHDGEWQLTKLTSRRALEGQKDSTR